MNNISMPETLGILLTSGQGVSTMICISSLYLKFIISSHAKSAQYVNRVWVQASCKPAALIFTCISDGVRHDVIQ